MGTEPLPFGVHDPVAGVAVEVAWSAIVRSVAEGAPDEDPDVWLGQLVLEVQCASDRAVALARGRADSLVIEARADAIAIREEGRRLAHSIARVRAMTNHGLGRELSDREFARIPTPPPPTHQPPAPPLPPPPIARVRTRATAQVANSPVEPLTDDPVASGSLVDRQTVAMEAGRISSGGATGPSVSQGRMERAMTPPLRLVVVAAIAVIVVALGLVTFEHYGTASQERNAQRHLAKDLALAEARRSPGGRPVAGEAFGSLSVPRLAIRGQAVVEGATLSALHRGPAHDVTSSQPGEAGAVVIVGHRRTYGAPFGQIGRLRVGDAISLRTPSGTYLYRVTRAPQILANPAATLHLPSPTSTGAGVQSSQSLVLATSADSRGSSLEVVVATLDRAGSVRGRVTSADSGTVGQLRAVPGDRVGLVLVLWWLAILGGAVYVGRRIGPRVPAAWVVVGLSIVGVIAVYQMYLAIDRLLPGTY
jgi:sortase A